MPRPKTGQTPAKDRQLAAKERLKAAGGARKSFNLGAEALVAIARIRKARGLQTDTEAVEEALHDTASRLMSR